MNTYTYHVKPISGPGFELTVEETSRKKADKYVSEMYPEKSAVVNYLSTQGGTLADFLGEESVARLTNKKHQQKLKAESDNRRYDKIKKAVK